MDANEFIVGRGLHDDWLFFKHKSCGEDLLVNTAWTHADLADLIIRAKEHECAPPS